MWPVEMFFVFDDVQAEEYVLPNEDKIVAAVHQAPPSRRPDRLRAPERASMARCSGLPRCSGCLAAARNLRLPGTIWLPCG
jgi:hypothetical protein